MGLRFLALKRQASQISPLRGVSPESDAPGPRGCHLGLEQLPPGCPIGTS